MFQLSSPSWRAVLKPEFSEPYFRQLERSLSTEYDQNTVYPESKHVFTALEQCPFETVSVVILGQDPYHGKGQAMGLAFSVRDDVRMPPSLQNIYKEIEREFGESPEHSGGNLTRWAEEGVLLLNSTLTVRAGSPGSHQGLGWETFTDAIITALSEKKQNLVFMLWGRHAQKKGAHIDRTKHLVLESPHPSPYSAATGFFGNGHFRKANEYLGMHGRKPINWL